MLEVVGKVIREGGIVYRGGFRRWVRVIIGFSRKLGWIFIGGDLLCLINSSCCRVESWREI